MFSTSQQKPHLLQDLRLALATLYSLPFPISQDGRGQYSSSDAHEYLLQFQARNLRRGRSSKNGSQNHQNQQHVTQGSLDVGSTWLACVALLSSLSASTNDPSVREVHYTEALFAAQTLVHRLRRVKLAEAIDIEFEPSVGSFCPVSSSPPRPEEILDGYRQWILQYYSDAPNLSSFSILSHLVHSYSPSSGPEQNIILIALEERIKGEISLMIIVGIMDALTKLSYRQAQQEGEAGIFVKVRPILKTLASALALIAARMRYVSTSLPSPAPHTQPIVSTILGVISLLQPKLNQQQQEVYRLEDSVKSLSSTCLIALPEAILTGSGSNCNNGGGAYGRFSLDPKCYTLVSRELRTEGMSQMCEVVQNIINSTDHSNPSILILQVCEAWAKYVPLPVHFINNTTPLILQAWGQFHLSNQPQQEVSSAAKAAMAYFIAVMEGGSWSVDQVLSSSLVQSKESSRQSNKKKTSSRSKKRHQQFLEENTTKDLLESAKLEVYQRGTVACTMAQQTLTVLRDLLILELQQINDSRHLNSDEDQDIQGDGPVGALTACANACLPYLLRSSIVQHDTTSMTLFATISDLIQQVCASPSRTVRSFAGESLYALHDTLVKILTDNRDIQLSTKFWEVAINHLYQSSINLALRCGYPSGFFDDLGQDNDEELESERNDVRDILRTISAIPSRTNAYNGTVPDSLTFVTSSLLLRLMQACAQPIREAAATNSLFSEPALHAFSALAKPINSAASTYANQIQMNMSETNIVSILNLALEIVMNAGRCLLVAFPVVSMNEILPLSRLYDLAIASLAPAFSTLCQIEMMKRDVETTIVVAIEAAATSLMRLPELTGPSTLRQTRFDIRGAMRSPGGEDHVGVLTLMRLAKESNPLSLFILKSKDSILVDLCGLHDALKKIEDQRGVGVFYGVGVLPKSRRILLGVICDLVILSGEKGQAFSFLLSMIESSITCIANAKQRLDNLDVEILTKICESAFDIAAFSYDIRSSLFTTGDSTSVQTLCLHVLEKAGNFGFVVAHDDSIQWATILGWNRLRAALFTLLKTSGNPDLPDSVMGILVSLIQGECEAATVQCSAGPTSSSRCFHEDVISEENIPPALFIRVIVETVDKAISSQIPIFKMRNMFHVLYVTRQSVLRSLLTVCPMPVQKGSFYDPRPIIAETWFLCMNKIATAAVHQGLNNDQEAGGGEILSVCKQLFLETFVAAISLLLYSSLEKKRERRSSDPGMSLDGPQGLVMMDFFVNFFNLGVSMLQAGAGELVSVVPVYAGNNADESFNGVAIIGAALFRGSQGGLPPWAVESIPSVYSSLFKALGKDVDTFGRIFEVSMNIRLIHTKKFGSIEGGSLLSGRFFENMSDKAKISFIDQAKECARSDTVASWRRLKTLIKQACGGKKKDTDFNQRPALTAWDTLDRV